MQALWMIAATFAFTLMSACVKWAAEMQANLSLIALMRGLLSVVVIGGWALWQRRSLRPPAWMPHIKRNAAGVAAMWLGFYAVTQLSLATATTLNYTSPLFLAGWVLIRSHGRPDPIRLLAVVLGFAGVLLVLRPAIGPGQVTAALVATAAGAMAAVAYWQVRGLGQIGEPDWRIVLYFSASVVLSGLVGLYFQPVGELPPMAWLPLVGLGLFGLLGQLAMTHAYASGSVLLSATLQYTAIVFAMVLGLLFWGDMPDTTAIVGTVVIIATSLLSTWRTMVRPPTK